MIARLPNFLPALGLALLVATMSNVADAGYVSSGMECIRGDATPIDLSLGAGATANDSATPVETFKVDQVARKLASVLNVPADFSPSNGMSPPPSEGSGSQPDLLVQDFAVQTARMSEWLGREGRAVLPPPLSTRIFRPPRFVG